MSKETVTLAPIRGRLAGGTATGDLTVHLKGGFRYVANLEVKGANVKTLLAEAKSAAGVTGTLAATGTFEGSGGLSTMKGRGRGTIADCRVQHGRTLALLAAILQVPELASPDFDECRAEFTQSGARLSTPVLRLVGKAVQLTGEGTVNLTTYALDYRMSLALAPQLFAKVTRPELRPAFRQRDDGFSAIDFRLYGTTLDPQTDLLSRIAKGAATDGREGPAQQAPQAEGLLTPTSGRSSMNGTAEAGRAYRKFSTSTRSLFTSSIWVNRRLRPSGDTAAPPLHVPGRPGMSTTRWTLPVANSKKSTPGRGAFSGFKK